MVDPKIFLEKFDKLPNSLQDLLSSNQLSQDLEDILKICQIEPIENYFEPIMETVEEILLLIKDQKTLEKEILNKTSLSSNQAQIVADLIRKKIFAPVSQELSLYTSPDNISASFMDALQQQQPENSTFEQKINQPVVPNPFEKFLNKEKEEIQPEEKPAIMPSPAIPQNQSPNNQTLKKERAPLLSQENLTPSSDILEEASMSAVKEPQHITLEKPLNKIKDLKRAKPPTVSEEEQKHIQEKLLEIMSKKKENVSEKVKEELEKAIKEGPKNVNQTSNQKETKISPQYKYFEEKKEEAILNIGNNEEFIPEEESNPQSKSNSEEPPLIIGAKVKEFPQKDKNLN